jgi:hypothetical protein
MMQTDKLESYFSQGCTQMDAPVQVVLPAGGGAVWTAVMFYHTAGHRLSIDQLSAYICVHPCETDSFFIADKGG